MLYTRFATVYLQQKKYSVSKFNNQMKASLIVDESVVFVVNVKDITNSYYHYVFYYFNNS